MGLRICLVTPFAWSQPHDVNEHVAGVAAELRKLGHTVTVVAPSGRARDLAAGRRALLDGQDAEVIAIAPTVPVSRRSSVGVPVGIRAALSFTLSRLQFDVVHGFEPGIPSLSYLALRDARALAVATFFSPERLGYPPGRAQRDRLLARIDALLATSPVVAGAASERFPGDYGIVSPGVDTTLFHPGRKRRRIVLEWRPEERPLARAVLRALRELPGWELTLLRTKPLSGRPFIPASLRDRVQVRTARDGQARAKLLNEAAIFVPSSEGMQRLRLEAQAAGAAAAAPARVQKQPELAAAAVARLAEDRAARDRDRAARRPRLDPLRPPHAHLLVARLLDRAGGAGRVRRGDRPGCDRGHRPQRLRRRARDGRDRARPQPGRDPRRGGQDRRTGRGDRPLPQRGDSARDVLRGHDRCDPGAGRARLPPPPLRANARRPRRGHASPAPGRDRPVRGLQRARPVRGRERRGTPVRAQVQPDDGSRL